LFGVFETGSHYVPQAGLGLSILLPQPPECWDYRNVPPHLDSREFCCPGPCRASWLGTGAQASFPSVPQSPASLRLWPLALSSPGFCGLLPPPEFCPHSQHRDICHALPGSLLAFLWCRQRFIPGLALAASYQTGLRATLTPVMDGAAAPLGLRQAQTPSIRSGWVPRSALTRPSCSPSGSPHSHPALSSSALISRAACHQNWGQREREQERERERERERIPGTSASLALAPAPGPPHLCSPCAGARLVRSFW
jgi:hypothetical protein